jgi:hypothetical protein
MDYLERRKVFLKTRLIFILMKIKITESQKKALVLELSKNSEGVKDFLSHVKESPGLLKFLGFSTHKSLEEFILDGSYKDFQELKKESQGFETDKK